MEFGGNCFKLGNPIKLYRGKWFKSRCFHLPTAGFCSVFAVILVQWSLFVGFSEGVPIVSVPLGSAISGYEKKIWVSENGVFAFGFLVDYQKDDDGCVVGIWYNLRPMAARVPVWTVGAGVRVSVNSTLQLSMDGNLALLDNPTGLLVWTSNTSGLCVHSASLLNNGNLVLTSLENKTVWESFHSPTDTLLPGQSLYYPQTLQPPSKNSMASSYSLVIRHSGDTELVWENNVTYWSSHLQPSVTAMEARFEANGVFGLFDAAGRIVWSKFSEDFTDPSVIFRHLRVDVDGNLRIYSWDQASETWRVVWQAVEDQCGVFGSCGLYSLCGYNSTGPICNCLVEDSENEAAISGSGYNGCKKMVGLGNCRFGESMMVMKQTVLYGLYPPHDIDSMLSAEDCKNRCLGDGSCFAATAKNDGSGLCTIKRTSFVSGYQHSSLAATSFLKVCLVPQAVSTQQAHFNHTSKPPAVVAEQQFMSHPDNVNQLVFSTGFLFLITVSVFVAMEMLVFWFMYRTRRTKAQRRNSFGKDTEIDPHCSVLVRFTFEELKGLTNDFADPLGPTVFKGVLPRKIPVIVKALDNTVASEREFRMVVSALGRTHHRNLVSLKGFCFEPKHRLLLYEYVSNGSLDEWLLGVGRKQKHNGVSWKERLDIAIGIARAIAYLHTECQQCIAHGNLTLKNVLLDSQFVPKVSDFGLRSLRHNEEGSASVESLPERDMYMFGEILLQIVTGSVEHNLHSWISEMYRCGDLGSVIDVRLEERVEWEGVERAVRIALWCMQDRSSLRPSIGEVVKVLEGAFFVDMPPRSAASATTEENRIGEEELDAIQEIVS